MICHGKNNSNEYPKGFFARWGGDAAIGARCAGAGR
jgi:hypothetical protein